MKIKFHHKVSLHSNLRTIHSRELTEGYWPPVWGKSWSFGSATSHFIHEQSRQLPHFSEVRGSYYYLNDDFRRWRAHFKNLVDQHQMTDPMAKQFAFACIRDLATQTVMDIPLYGPETLGQMLNAYHVRFCPV